MASPVYQTVSGNSGTAASFTATEPTGAASGDGLLLFVFSDTNPSGFTPPAGWNLEISQTVTDGTNTFQARIYSIRRGGSAPALGASWTGSLYFEWTIVRISGIVASGSFVEVLTSARRLGRAAAPDSPSATPLTDEHTRAIDGVVVGGLHRKPSCPHWLHEHPPGSQYRQRPSLQDPLDDGC
jgi:hypothetical protein